MNPLARRRTVLIWLMGWFGASVIGVLNGVLRTTYSERVGEARAHRISTVTLIVALVGYMWGLHRRRPFETSRQAVMVGSLWAVFTMAFEFGLGAARGLSWEEMTKDYDVTEGRVWIAIPLVMAAGPPMVHRLQ